jgi:Zn-dependent peptidase ImmA (M78 family)
MAATAPPYPRPESSEDSNAPAETRANAFAVHFILPATVILQRRAEATLDLRDPEALVGLAMEYGLSAHSLTWHLKNVLDLTEAERRRIGQLVAEPFRLARRLGLAERVRQEQRAESRPGWPRHYLALVWQAFDRGDLDGSYNPKLWTGRVDVSAAYLPG